MTSLLLIAISFLPFFEARNTAANYVINPPEAGAEEIKFEKPNLELTSKCPACEGEGVIVLEETDFGQINATRLGKAKRIREKCSFCGGRKSFVTFMNPNELEVQIAKDFEKYKASHLSKGEIQVGNAFVPNASYEGVDRKKLKQIEKTYGDACRSCHWSGIEECGKCDGRGYIKCPNSDCKGGWAVTKNTTSYSKTSSGGIRNRGSYNSSGSSRRYSRKETKVIVQLCPDCEGAKMVKCPKCLGRKAEVCKKCNGLGMKQKNF